MDKHPTPETMLQAVRPFADPQAAHDFFVQIGFPNGVACQRRACDSTNVTFYPKNLHWDRPECRKPFSTKFGTDRHLAEQVCRFNEREAKYGARFIKVTKAADGKRLTYKAPPADSGDEKHPLLRR